MAEIEDHFELTSEHTHMIHTTLLTTHMHTRPQAMSHAVYMHDIQHVIVDNLQFMLGARVSSIMDQYSIQNQAIAALRKFASSQNVHVTVVIHPRKVGTLIGW